MTPRTMRRTIDLLLIGDNLKHKAKARTFLSHLIQDCEPKHRMMIVPIARRLMIYDNWSEKVTIKYLLEYSNKKYDRFLELRRDNSPDDPQAQYIANLTLIIAQDLGLI